MSSSRVYTSADENTFNALKRRKVAICKGVAEMEKAMQLTIEVVKSMDGKVMNKRLFTAIQDKINEVMGEQKVSVYRDDDYNGRVSICYTLYNRSYPDSEPDACGNYTCSYFDSELYSHVYTETISTIEAEKIVSALEIAIKCNNQIAYKYIDAVKNFKRDLAKYNKALDAFRKVYGEINPLLKDDSLSSYELSKGYIYPKPTPWEEKRNKAMNL